MRKIASVIILSIILGSTLNCKMEKKVYKGGPYYFSSWKNYKIPFEPVGEISIEEASKLDCYYEAYFDKTGKLIFFKKICNGNLEWNDEYFYSNGKLYKRIMKMKNGKIIIQYFDKKGKIIKENNF